MTDISTVVLTLNEADNIVDMLDSAEPIFQELVLVDGGSTDGTVDLAEDWCNSHDKAFHVVESSEREYLLEGAGVQRRRGANAAQHDYILAMGADVIVEVHDEDWFDREMDHFAYCHTRVKPSGLVQKDYRLYDKYQGKNPKTQNMSNLFRWRGMIHEELRNRSGEHVSDVLKIGEAPMTHHQQRHGAMDTQSILGRQQHAHDPEVGGNSGTSLRKQHFLMAQALASPHQQKYLADSWDVYYDRNERLIIDHAEQIADEFDLPRHYADRPKDVKNTPEAEWWDLPSGEPIMDFETESRIKRIKQALL